MMGGMSASALSPWLVLLCDLSVKSALLLLVAWALMLAMRRTSAAARHLVWLLTFAALLLLPLLSVTLPARSVPVLPPPAAPFVSLRGPLAANNGGTGEAISGSSRIGGGGVSALEPLSAPDRVLPARALPPASPNWPSLLCCFWLLGVMLAVLPLAAGWTLAARRIRRCTPVTDPATLALAAEAGRQLGLRRPVFLRSGPSVSVPVTFGLVRPVILLPDGAVSWPAERLRVALLHELAHIRRGDWAMQTGARLVCALFWHNPLVWPAARMLRAEAERACDDLILSAGIPAPDYAQHLLAVAAALAGVNRPLPLAVPMAGRGPLESRLRAVLTIRPRRAPSRRLAALAFLVALVVLVPLAALRPAARAARRVVPPLMSAPVVLPAPPKAVLPSHSPIKASVAVPPAFVPTKSIPTGVPPMKPLMPVKTFALAALAASFALPAAHAKPAPLIKHTPAPTRANTWARERLRRDFLAYQKAYYGKRLVPPTTLKLSYGPALSHSSWVSSFSAAQRLPSNPLVTLDLKEIPIRPALDALFAAAKVNYTVAAGVPDDKDTVTVHLTNVPLAQALDAVLAASDTQLTYTVGEGGIIAVAPPHTNNDLFGVRSRALFAITRHDGATEQEIAALFMEREAELAGGVKTPQHPDIVALDARIAELERGQRAGESGKMKRRPVNPVPGKTP